MKKANLFSVAMLSSLLFTPISHAEDVLTGDKKLACEAILCLASGQQPSECAPSLRRYFSISYKKLSDTLRGRYNFLKLCPTANQGQDMESLVSALANGAGRCDAQSLNTDLQYAGGYEGYQTFIGNQLPTYCQTYTTHTNVNIASLDLVPKYVGTPEKGGFWVESKDFEKARASYNAKLKAQEQAKNAPIPSGQ